MTYEQKTDELLKGCRVKVKEEYLHGEKLKTICGDEEFEYIIYCPKCKSKIAQKLEDEKEFLEFLNKYREYLLHFIQGEHYESSAIDDLDTETEDLEKSIKELEIVK